VRMGYPFSIQDLLQGAEECIELLGFDDGPRHDVDPPTMETRDKVGLLLPLDDLLELETEPGVHNVRSDRYRRTKGRIRTLS
jgi:hypothetical protein